MATGNTRNNDDRSRSPHAKPSQESENVPVEEEQDEQKQVLPQGDIDNDQTYRIQRIQGPYLLPEDTDQDDTFTLLKVGEYVATPATETSRENFIGSTGKQVPAATELLESDSKLRRKLLQKYLQAIHDHPTKWQFFPDLDEYFEMVEKKENQRVSYITIPVRG